MLVWLCLGALGCGSGGPGDSRTAVAPEPAIEASLPAQAVEFAPAETRLTAGSRLTGKGLGDMQVCGRCHPDVVSQWSSSAHAWTSFNNPVYRVSIDGFRARQSPAASQFCAGCHDIALLIDRAMVDAIRPEDPRAHGGVNCRVCHGITETRNDGNGSYTLSDRPIPLPDPDDSTSVERHVGAVSVRHLGSALCLTCHRSFLGPETGNPFHLPGMDDAADWQRSPYAGQGAGRVDSGVAERECVDCHMMAEAASVDEAARTEGVVSSHRFLGAHTWLAAMRGDADQVQRVAERLVGVASVDIAVAVSQPPVDQAAPDAALIPVRSLPADAAPLHPGGRLALDVVVRNLGVGHRFPGGVKDAQDVWLEVQVADARGRAIASSGQAHRDDPMDMEAHVLRALLADEHGEILFAREVDTFRAAIVDHTIAPRDAQVVRYAMDVPPASAGYEEPFVATATLYHRTRNLILQERACADTRTETGQAFAAISQEIRGLALDACAPQPVVEVARSRVWLGDGAAQRQAGVAPRPAWQRLYEHGMAWNHAVQERLEEARPSLERALEAVRADAQASPRDEAMILAALGQLTGRQGRTQEALDWLERAERLAPGVTALAAFRGAALSQVWRWDEAVAPLSLAASKAPRNAGVWTELAVALGSVGKSREALDAARQGLALEPRNGALLRVQALSVRALGGAQAERALDAYDRFRATEQATEIRFACAARSAACAREREPVHVHEMMTATHPE